MVRRVNLIILLGLIIALVFSFGLLASAQTAGTADAAVAIGKQQVGKPFQYGADGPDSFSCVGLMRYILRTNGTDPDAPWVPEEYLNKYQRVSLQNLQPGDIVIYPDWATMYVGDGWLLNANQLEGKVTYTRMDYAGTPLGAVRPPYK